MTMSSSRKAKSFQIVESMWWLCSSRDFRGHAMPLTTVSSRMIPFSGSLPHGLALVEEGVHALAEVAAHIAHQDEVVGFRRHHAFLDAAHRLLGGAERERRVAGHQPREVLAACQQRRVVG